MLSFIDNFLLKLFYNKNSTNGIQSNNMANR
jgi:hypothetical protein